MQVDIRPARLPEDLGDILSIRLMKSVMNNIDSVPSETTAWVERALQNEDSNFHMFVAETTLPNGCKRMIGNVILRLHPVLRARHCGSISIMVHEDYHGKGVGTKLMEAVLDLSDNYLKLIRLELTVATDNTRAVHLYENMGFEKEALLRKTTITNGLYTDDYLMARIKA